MLAPPRSPPSLSLCVEQLLMTYGAMLFVQKEPLGRDTPAQMASDLDVFRDLVSTLCAGAPASKRQRAERLLRLLQLVSTLLSALLDTPAEGRADPPFAAICGHVAELRALDGGFSRELLSRLASKCNASDFSKGKRRAALLDACDAALGGGAPAAAAAPSPAAATPAKSKAESELRFFARVAQSLRMGRKFSVQRILELRDGDLEGIS